MKNHIFAAQLSNRVIKLQYVANSLKVVVAMPANEPKNLNMVASELSKMVVLQNSKR